MINGSEFSVSRIAHANNKSEYFIDDVQTTFGQIASLLKSKGIDLDNNRFLILQVCCQESEIHCMKRILCVKGEVELISQMKPRGTNLRDVGLLEYLEEIIGSDKHVDRIEQLSGNLEVATSEKESMQRRVRSVELETAQLAEKKGDAEQFLRQKANCIQLQMKKNAYYSMYLKVLLFLECLPSTVSVVERIRDNEDSN